ncbi:hypothetical protein DTO164E3_3057 [Paecilomyces variotii]|nr:hypothetical protein DTO032I3_4656 [Paecilomyces variotii]KAJ9202617.1 hypothetical protein DTO164E3_3057 [Paecilomyces variotii]KAJ9224500.1 hypothetical protein DTO169C6_3049 [Paecilomyces variotii]KAJ9265807.1 hypothetical protein DTO195F2_1409 [Paecilomyces variotii]KAJ9283076.1 hypothetical protein DTO021D3_413 [Paecilomyces variotii]
MGIRERPVAISNTLALTLRVTTRPRQTISIQARLLRYRRYSCAVQEYPDPSAATCPRLWQDHIAWPNQEQLSYLLPLDFPS